MARAVLRSHAVALLLVPLMLHVAQPVFAQSDNKAAAKAHFDKGVAAFSDRRFAEAADEFDAAYRLSPAYVVLYNIGQVNAALGRSVEAVDAYEKYLKQGASSVTSERRQSVFDEIEKQRARIGTVDVRTFPEGATLRLDGALAGHTPLAAPLRVNTGKHTVEAQMDGHRPETRDVLVEGRTNVNLELTLTPIAVPAAPAVAVVAPPKLESAPTERTIVLPLQMAPSPAAVNPAPEESTNERVVDRSTARSSPSSYPATAQRIVGLVLIAGGLGTATTGGIIAYKASVSNKDAIDRLASDSLTSDERAAAMADFDSSKSRNQHGWIIAAVGAAVTIVGGVLVATVPDRSSSLAWTPSLTASGGGWSLSGVF